MQGEILCCIAIIKAEGIKPFSEFEPHTSNELIAHLEKQLQGNDYPKLMVYPEEDHFVMSDDYNAYYFGKKNGFKDFVCIVIGEAEGPFVIQKSESFRYPVPEAQEI